MSSVKSHLSIFSLLILVAVAYSQENLCIHDPFGLSVWISYCPADQKEAWTYRGFKGAMFWGLQYPACYGRKQSPIDIITSNVEKGQNLEPLSLENYGVLQQATIKNNGHTIEVTPSDDVTRTISVGGKTYNLRQFHFHWGCKYSQGSEHAIDGTYYANEVHFVHTSEDGQIAVVGVLFKEQVDNNDDLREIVDQLPEVMYKGDETELTAPLQLNNLIPNPLSYYRYEGSLTTPECTEGVTWSVATKIINIGTKQMDAFRALYSSEEADSSDHCKLAGNYRPVQPLNDRTVYQSQ